MKSGKESISYYPVFLNVGSKKCTVAGGGRVALRKVNTLLQYGLAIEVISSRVSAGISELAEKGKISLLKRNYQAGDIDNSFMVIAATGNHHLNREIAQEAHEKKILVNVVDDPANCDFIVPSSFRRGDIIFAISTGGKSPALARRLRLRLEEEFGAEYVALADLVGEMRIEMAGKGIKLDGDAWQQVLDLDRLTDLLRSGREDEARQYLSQKILEQRA